MRQAEAAARSRVRFTIILIALLGVLTGFFLRNGDLLQGAWKILSLFFSLLFIIHRKQADSLNAEFILTPNACYLIGY